MHPFDAALALSPDREGQPGQFQGHTQAAWWNMVGPFGGISAAVMLQAVLRHPALHGTPVALTVNYTAAMNEGPYTIVATPVRTSRSTQHWTVQLCQSHGPEGAVVVLTATVMTALRRPGWGASDSPMPRVPAPQTLARATAPPGGLPWLQRYDLRTVTGGLEFLQVGHKPGAAVHGTSLSQIWIRDEPARSLDFAALAAQADIFFPRVWLRRGQTCAAGTVSYTVYFHVGTQALQNCADAWVLGQACGQGYGDGFFDQTGQLWSEHGQLLVTTHQLVYFKD